MTGISASKHGDQSDEDLLTAIAIRGDREAFNELFKRFAVRIKAMGFKMTKNEQLSHDLVQDAMLAVWQKSSQFDSDRGNAQSWIFTLVRNRCFDLLRQQNRQPGVFAADDIWELESSSSELQDAEESENRFFANLEINQFRKYLEKLSAPQQRVIEEVYINGLTHEEASRVLDIPQGTVKSRLRLGIDKLRQLLGVAL